MSLMTAEAARSKGLRDKFGTTPFLTPGRVASLLDILGPLDADGRTLTAPPRVAYEWNERVMRPLGYTVLGKLVPHWDIPSTYEDSGGATDALGQVDSDFGAAADFAMRWRVLGDADAATKCVEILTAWSTQVISPTITNTSGPLSWCSRWPTMIMAAMFVSDFEGYSEALDLALKDLTRSGLSLSLAYTNSNNTGAWGVCLELASAVFLQDRAAFDRAIRRWYSLFDHSIVNNEPVEEVRRQGGVQGDGSTGLWYSNFTVYAFIAAAEWARFGGEWLYDHSAPDGSTVRGLAARVQFWTRYPETFTYNTSGTPSTTFRSLPHDEIIHALWPSAESAWIVNRFPAGNDRESSGFRNAALIYRGRPLYG